jgi:ABC-type transport system substrate-binding protein
MFFGHAADSPFRDERVRQATSMSWDRNLYIEVAFETKKFEGEGLPMNKAWDAATPPATFPAVWLDPQGKDFGPNAKYFKYDPAEAKKLMSAAGATAPLESDFIYALTFPPITYRRKDFMLGLLTDSGNFKPKIES